jgi:hypothetical protein
LPDTIVDFNEEMINGKLHYKLYFENKNTLTVSLTALINSNKL